MEVRKREQGPESTRPRVAIIGTRGYPSFYGGFETLLRHLVPYLSSAGWDVDVYCRPEVRAAETPVAQGSGGDKGRITQHYTSGLDSKSMSTLTYGFTSTAHAVKSRPNVALVMNVANGYWLRLLRARGIPTAVNVDGIEWDRQKWGNLAKKVFLRGATMTAASGTTLIYDAQAIRTRWQSDFGRDGVFIPYGATQVSGSDPVLGLQRGKYVLYVARFVPENSIREFIQAADLLSCEIPVVIVGSTGYGGEIEDSVRRLVESRANTIWTGHLRDDAKIFALWENAGVYFHGHSVGGTNPALVQAMACGAPTVARDTIYNREVLGPNGSFVDPEPTAIASELSRVISDDDLREKLATDATKRQRAHYTWDLVCDRYDQVLRDLLAHSPNGSSSMTSELR